MGTLRRIGGIAPLRALLLAIFIPWTAGNAGRASVGQMAQKELDIPASRAVSAYGGFCGRTPGHQLLERCWNPRPPFVVMHVCYICRVPARQGKPVFSFSEPGVFTRLLFFLCCSPNVFLTD